MKKMRRYQRIIIWVVIIASLTSLDWPLGFLRSFWLEHAFTSGIITGLLLLGFGLFVVEAWFEDREALRWKNVAYIALKELGFVTDNLLYGMNYLLTGERKETERIPIDNKIHDQLLSCLDQQGFLSNNDICNKDRLQILLQDEQWIKIAVTILDSLKHQHRRNLAIWVPVILTVEEFSPLINESALVNESVFFLQDILRTAVNPGDARFSTDEIQKLAVDPYSIKSKVIKQWQETHEKITVLQQKCMHAAQIIHWENPHGHFTHDTNIKQN